MKSSLFGRIGSVLMGSVFLLSAVPALADTSTTSATSTTGTYNTVCAQTAVGVHEDANASALATYNTAVAAALSVRKTDMVSAWGNVGFRARFEALKAAIVKYRASIKTARANYKTAQAAANATFEASMKSCGVTSADVKGSGKLEKKEGRIGLGLGLWGDFGLHLGKDKKENKDR